MFWSIVFKMAALGFFLSSFLAQIDTRRLLVLIASSSMIIGLLYEILDKLDHRPREKEGK